MSLILFIKKKLIMKISRRELTSFLVLPLLGPDYQTDSDAISQLLFKNYMAKVKSHYESINKSQGCLTINGVDAEGQPLLISLKYIKKRGCGLLTIFISLFSKGKATFFSMQPARMLCQTKLPKKPHYAAFLVTYPYFS